MKILELPFQERPALELLHFDDGRQTVDRTYAGYGWARVPRIDLVDANGKRQTVEDALVLGVHSADDGEPLADDIELEFELPGADPVTVLASTFLERWLPVLPSATNVVLAMCNPHNAVLRVPGASGTDATPIHYATGDVDAWIDDDQGGRLELSAHGSWATLGRVSTALERIKPIDEDQKHSLISLWIMKKLDIKPQDGGMEFPVVLPSDLSPLDDTLQQMAVEDFVKINPKKARYELTKKGIDYLGQVIDEAEEMVDELEELETEEAVEELRKRNVDLMRARFLWGWYEGELDDLVLFQERRGVQPIERMWAFYLASDDFFRELSKDFQ